MSEFYHPESARGLRWDDPALAITWPLENVVISDKDRAHPLTRPENSNANPTNRRNRAAGLELIRNNPGHDIVAPRKRA